MIPNDPVMLLSYINMKLRDKYATLNELCVDINIDENRLRKKLESINYFYNDIKNQFC